ncbi:MAG TPA: hypothetical protein VMU26_31680 [Candidatus Polarisedimenticolia bacterium]|nr:hypothetical protein [Candidatus Polarisedimenticolia bacterium]
MKIQVYADTDAVALVASTRIQGPPLSGQELVSTSVESFWTTTLSLEVVPGGRAAECGPGGGAQWHST